MERAELSAPPADLAASPSEKHSPILARLQLHLSGIDVRKKIAPNRRAAPNDQSADPAPPPGPAHLVHQNQFPRHFALQVQI